MRCMHCALSWHHDNTLGSGANHAAVVTELPKSRKTPRIPHDISYQCKAHQHCCQTAPAPKAFNRTTQPAAPSRNRKPRVRSDKNEIRQRYISAKKKMANPQTHLFTSPSKPLDHLSVQPERERRFRSIVGSSSRVSGSVWSHGLFFDRSRFS